METVQARDLKTGIRFIDPHREGRRAAEVKDVLEINDERVFVELRDDTTLGAWVASYQPDVALELASA